ncbi:MAG: hypothetical protein IH600_17845 [Bacteroidetes bacterium]|nr:hypothetical protein [Bacteroidota bacterium]
MNLGNVVRVFGLLMLGLCCLASNGHAQWTRLSTLDGVSPRDFATTTSGVIYLLDNTDDGIYYSTDRGDNWNHRSDLDTLSITVLQAYGNDLYFLASSLSFSVFKNCIHRLDRPDGIPDTIPSPRSGSVGTFFIADNGWLYATLEGNPATDSVYLSTDGGQNWNSVCKKFSDVHGMNGLRVDPLQRIWSYNQWGIARYDFDSGQWLRKDEFGSMNSSTRWYFFLPNGEVYINTGFRVVRLSKDGDAYSTLYESTFSAYPTLEFWVTGDGALLISERAHDYTHECLAYRISTDGGASWSFVDTSRDLQLRFLGESQGTLFSAHVEEIFRSTDMGRTIEYCGAGIASARVRDFEIRGENLHVLTSRYALSGDGGASWVYRRSDESTSPSGFHVTSNGTFFESPGWFRVSKDSARTWTEPLPHDGGNQVIELIARDDMVLGIFSDNSIRRSFDEGMTWTTVYQTSGSSWMYQFLDLPHGFYALKDDQLIRSSDLGATWSSIPLPATEGPFLFGNQRVLLLSASSVLWSSSDHGDSWQPLPLDTLSRTLIHVSSNDEGHLAAIRAGGKGSRTYLDVIYSVNDGRSWKKITENLPRAFVNSGGGLGVLTGFTSANKLFVSVPYRGLYFYDASTLDVRREPPVAASIRMDIWPTISNAEVRIGWETRSAARLRITTLTGAVMHDRAYSAGEQIHCIDIGSWPAGTYHVRVLADGLSGTGKFVVVR